jgi:sterol desaturase/sphingolipid hydroxylase (fatty acid hydroxylase superfamily)
MSPLLHFFEHIQSWQRSLLLVCGLLFFWCLEGIMPLFRLRYNKLRHAGLNLFFTLTTILVNFLFAWLIVRGSDFTSHRKIGLLYLFPLPTWLFLVAGLLFLDLVSAWLIHWILHQFKWTWKFHLVHHSDTWVDTTTANRHHPVESVFRAGFTILAVIACGAPIGLVYLYQSLSVLLSQFNHANISLPRWIDRALSWVIVSPDMHKVHHHFQQPLTDTNYGNIFSCWDRIFRTFASIPGKESLRYGIDTHLQEKENNRVGRLLEIPFGPYRPPAGAKFSK